MAEAAEANGLRRILIATVIAGVGGYAITAIVARALGNEYKLFAIFWSALYLTVGALAGVQQEVARGTHRRHEIAVDRVASSVTFAIGIAAVVAVVVPLSSPFWGQAVFGAKAASMVPPLAFGAATYVFVAVASGTMYGIRLWRPLSMIIVLDVALRLVIVVIGIVLRVDIVGLAWATVIPFPLVLLTLWIVARERLVGASILDVHYAAATINVVRTVLAASATSVLVSGFPLLLAASSPNASARAMSALIFALILTRAPLVVSALALQSYLIVFFRDRADSWVRSLAILLLCAGVAGAILAALAWWIGVPVIVAVAGATFSLDPSFLALLVLSSVSTAWLALTATAVLALTAHNFYSLGWVLAAACAIALLFVPADLETRAILALAIGPLAGLLVQVVALIVNGRAPRGSSRIEIAR